MVWPSKFKPFCDMLRRGVLASQTNFKITMQLDMNGKPIDIGTSLRESVDRKFPASTVKCVASPMDAQVTNLQRGAIFWNDIGWAQPHNK